MNFSHRERMIFIMCLAAISIYIGYLLFYVPLKERQDDTLNAIKDTKRQMRKDLKFVQEAKSQRTEYDRYKNQFKQTTTDEGVMSALLSDVDHISQQFKVRISEMKPQKVRKFDFYNTFAVSLTMEGSLKEVIHFLHTLQGDPYFLDIEEIRFDKHFQRTADIQCQLIVHKVLFP